MSDAPQHEAHRRPHTPPMADPFMELDLPEEIHRLHAETTWNTGQNVRTLIKYDDFRVVLIALAAEALMQEHKADGRISIHVLFRPHSAESLGADVQPSLRRAACPRPWRLSRRART